MPAPNQHFPKPPTNKEPHMKNWEPLVSGPLFAMDRRKPWSCLSLKDSSSSGRHHNSKHNSHCNQGKTVAVTTVAMVTALPQSLHVFSQNQATRAVSTPYSCITMLTTEETAIYRFPTCSVSYKESSIRTNKLLLQRMYASKLQPGDN